MTLPLLSYSLTTQNARVSNLAGDLDSNSRNLTGSLNNSSDGRDEINTSIEQAYRQIFFHAMRTDRDPYLESQLRSGSITIRDFIRGLLLSRRFSEGYYQCSSNYRMVDQVVGRALGRPVHGDAERRAWSIVIGEQGFTAFVDQLLDSEEYMDSFGYDRVPTQRSRVLPGQATGELPIYQAYPRYGTDWRDLQWSNGTQTRVETDTLTPAYIKTPEWATKAWLGLATIGGIEIARVIIIIASEMYGTR